MIGKLAPAKELKFSLTGITKFLLIATNSANPPIGGIPITFVPTEISTFSPLSSIIPHTSLPGIKGGSITIWYFPCTNSASGKLTPATSTLIITSSLPIVGLSTSFISNKFGSPNFVHTTAFIFPSQSFPTTFLQSLFFLRYLLFF